MNDGRDVARAIDALRRGWPVRIDGTAFLAVETADEDSLRQFDEARAADILISGNRAVTLKLANQIEGTPTGPVLVARAPWIDLAGATAVADPALDLSHPLKGPFQTLAIEDQTTAEAALRLARLAGLLPAFFMGAAEADVCVPSAAVNAAASVANVRIASRAKLPTATSEKAEIVAFRTADDASEHVALLIGAPSGQPPLVRLHSECLTGDVLGSLKCDCGPQLNDALAAISASGWGILLYLRQEGRGIGLVNKLRAYALQDQGFDTVDANHRLGFGDDERDFGIAAAMLRALGQEEVRLLTNNPRKVAGLEAAGIGVSEQVPLKSGSNPYNQAYLDTKRLRSGHQL
ncbi:MAG TPA: GTP cyclohydrolase II [Allosphingosinicella sp.]|uniref:GTP cyclohydrolase II n=1 Tax=Allosphingosinicella sp. TaxID=2823234 RepID=UPI002ED7B2CF